MTVKDLAITGNHTKPVGVGTVVSFLATMPSRGAIDHYELQWIILGPFSNSKSQVDGGTHFDWDTTGLRPGRYTIYCKRTPKPGTGTAFDEAGGPIQIPVAESDEQVKALFGWHQSTTPTEENVRPDQETNEYTEDDDYDTYQYSNPWHLFLEGSAGVGPDGTVPVSLQRTALQPTPSQLLWIIIRNRTNAISFRRFRPYCDAVMCGSGVRRPDGSIERHMLNFRGSEAYDVLRRSTDAFLMQETGVIGEDPGHISAFLDPDHAITDINLQLSDPGRALRLRIEEKRRLGDASAFEDINRFRDMYYEQLENEKDLLPYLSIVRNKLRDIPLKSTEDLPPGQDANCYGILKSHLSGPLAIELLWSYWHEESMLVQALNAITARFENRKIVAGRLDPLTRLDIDPLRPLGNLLWGWIQDEYRRLTVRRRAFEYDHEYGLRLMGKAIPDMEPVDSRTKFLASFHTLLNLAHVFFKEDDDTTVIADGFPLLNALRETHLLLAEGAHNQFGDLPASARAEMLIMQWLMARPEMREFIGGKIMVPYEEEWMDRVDTMKSIQGWTNVSVTHFRDMGVYGEQLLLSIRYGNWSVINDPQEAANWARYWRAEVQRYTHAYRAATGVDLTQRVDATMPSLLLARQASVARRPG